MARENDVIHFCLPPHITHALQPLDVSVFKSLKTNFSKAVHALSFAKKNFIVSKREFAKVVKAPFEKAFSISNIKAGFAKCGIYPYNPNTIDQSKLASSLNLSSSSTGVAAQQLYILRVVVAIVIHQQARLYSVLMTPIIIPSVNPSPIVSSLSSHNPDDGYCSPQVPGESDINHSYFPFYGPASHCHLTVILWCNLLLLSLLEELLKCQMSPSLRHQPQLLLLLWTSKPCHGHLTVIFWCNTLLSLLEKLLRTPW